MLTIYQKDQPSIQKNQPIYMQPYPHQPQMQPYPLQHPQMQPYPLHHPQMQPYPLHHPQMMPYPHHPQMMPYPHHPQMMPYSNPQMMPYSNPQMMPYSNPQMMPYLQPQMTQPQMIYPYVPVDTNNNQYLNMEPGYEEYQNMVNLHKRLMKMMDENPNYTIMDINELIASASASASVSVSASGSGIIGEECPNVLLESQESESTVTTQM
jgi:hypothetical protein